MISTSLLGIEQWKKSRKISVQLFENLASTVDLATEVAGCDRNIYLVRSYRLCPNGQCGYCHSVLQDCLFLNKLAEISSTVKFNYS